MGSVDAAVMPPRGGIDGVKALHGRPIYGDSPALGDYRQPEPNANDKEV